MAKKFSEQTHAELLLVGFLLIAIIIALSMQFSNVSAENRIKQKLAGRELVYYDLKGEPQAEIIEADDIKSVSFGKSGTFEECMSQACWIASIQTPLPWEIYFDKDINELGIRQMFMT